LALKTGCDRRFLCRQRDLFAECVVRLDGLFGVLGIRHDWV
jgi:hypothetical protein